MPTPTHKSATSVTLAPLAEKSPFEQFVERVWKPAAIVALLIAAWIVYATFQSQKEREQRDQSWAVLTERAPLEGFPRIPTAPPPTFEALAGGDLKGTEAGPWVRLLEARAYAEDRDYAKAREALETLKAEYPGHSLVTDTWSYGSEGAPHTLVEHWSNRLAEREAWEKAHEHLFGNPPPPAGAPRVRIETDQGTFVVALFPEAAPEHVQGFLDKATSGYYVGTKIYRIDPQVGIDAGDPATREGEPSTWGRDVPDQVLPKVDSPLSHFAGAVSAAPGPNREGSSGALFSVLVEDRHELDDERVVFGVVESGLDVVRQIAAAEQDKDAPGRPARPVSIVATTKVE
jgi:cyclophilin family peptidyl-prolyl cis-trans isomerase